MFYLQISNTKIDDLIETVTSCKIDKNVENNYHIKTHESIK